MIEEVEWKLERLRTLMKEKDLEGVILSRNDDFSWITAGGRGWVARGALLSVASVVVTHKELFLVANNIEMERLLREEVPEGFEPLEYKWHEDPYEKVFKKFPLDRFGSDTGAYGTLDISSDMIPLRSELSPWEIKRYKEYGKGLEKAFEKAILSFKPDMNEYEAAATLEKALVEKGFNVPVLLIFSDESRKEYRHNIFRDKKLGERFFASTCAEKRGLVLAMTRTASFVEDEDFMKQHLDNLKIDSEIFLATEEEITLGEMFERIRSIYEKYGYGGEFEKHHQGGLIGYNPREEIAEEGSKTILKKNMALCWNPTITGTKAEDTFVLGDTFVTFTDESEWPIVEVKVSGRVVKRPGVKILGRS